MFWIHPGAVIGENVRIGPFTYIGGGVTIGNNVRIGVGSIIGNVPEHKDYWHLEDLEVLIEDNCFISNQVTIDAGTKGPTHVERDCILLKNAHVGHDARIGRSSTLSCSSIVGGHTIVGAHCNLGMHATLHQNLQIPMGVMIGMNGTVTKKSKLRPFYVYAGNPVRELKFNQVGYERSKQ